MREELASRFWKKVDKRGDDECWNWTAALSPKGYGVIGIAGRGSGTIAAHRCSYQINVGEIPDGLLVCHKCDNPSCVNPGHLFLGTAKDNTQDMMSKGRHKYGKMPDGYKMEERFIKRGESQSNSKLKESDIPIIRASKERQCDLAARYGVDPALIWRIKVRKAWVHIP